MIHLGLSLSSNCPLDYSFYFFNPFYTQDVRSCVLVLLFSWIISGLILFIQQISFRFFTDFDSYFDPISFLKCTFSIFREYCIKFSIKILWCHSLSTFMFSFFNRRIFFFFFFYICTEFSTQLTGNNQQTFSFFTVDCLRKLVLLSVPLIQITVLLFAWCFLTMRNAQQPTDVCYNCPLTRDRFAYLSFCLQYV